MRSTAVCLVTGPMFGVAFHRVDQLHLDLVPGQVIRMHDSPHGVRGFLRIVQFPLRIAVELDPDLADEKIIHQLGHALGQQLHRRRLAQVRLPR